MIYNFLIYLFKIFIIDSGLSLFYILILIPIKILIHLFKKIFIYLLLILLILQLHFFIHILIYLMCRYQSLTHGFELYHQISSTYS